MDNNLTFIEFVLELFSPLLLFFKSELVLFDVRFEVVNLLLFIFELLILLTELFNNLLKLGLVDSLIALQMLHLSDVLLELSFLVVDRLVGSVELHHQSLDFFIFLLKLGFKVLIVRLEIAYLLFGVWVDLVIR